MEEKSQFRHAVSGFAPTNTPFHDLRHSSLTNGAAAGEQPIALMARAGHRSMSATGMFTNSMRPGCAGLVTVGLQSVGSMAYVR